MISVKDMISEGLTTFLCHHSFLASSQGLALGQVSSVQTLVSVGQGSLDQALISHLGSDQALISSKGQDSSFSLLALIEESISTSILEEEEGVVVVVASFSEEGGVGESNRVVPGFVLLLRRHCL